MSKGVSCQSLTEIIQIGKTLRHWAGIASSQSWVTKKSK